MTDSEILLRQFADFPHDAGKQDALLGSLIESDSEMLASAEYTYFNYCEARNLGVDCNFRAKFVRAWSVFTRNALSHIGAAQPDAVSVELGPSTPALYVLWHFPEYPLLMRELLKRKITVAVAQESEWLQPLMRAGLAANFTRLGGGLALRRACESRKSVAMMVDYCYEGTRHRVVDFLGLPCKTPSGLVEMANQFGLDVRLVSCNGHEIHTEMAPPSRDTQECLYWLNSSIGEYVEKAPSRWLLWPSLNARIAR